MRRCFYDREIGNPDRHEARRCAVGSGEDGPRSSPRRRPSLEVPVADHEPTRGLPDSSPPGPPGSMTIPKAECQGSLNGDSSPATPMNCLGLIGAHSAWSHHTAIAAELASRDAGQESPFIGLCSWRRPETSDVEDREQQAPRQKPWGSCSDGLVPRHDRSPLSSERFRWISMVWASATY